MAEVQRLRKVTVPTILCRESLDIAEKVLAAYRLRIKTTSVKSSGLRRFQS